MIFPNNIVYLTLFRSFSAETDGRLKLLKTRSLAFFPVTPLKSIQDTKHNKAIW